MRQRPRKTDSDGDLQYPNEIDVIDSDGDQQYPFEIDMIDGDGDLQADDETDLCNLTQCAALEPVSNTAAAPFKFTGKFNSRERLLSTMQITMGRINGTTTVIDIDPAMGTVIDVQAICP